MRRGVLQTETVRERGLREFERQTAGVPEHFGRPFVRIARKRNALMLKDRADGLRVENRLQLRRFAKRGGFSFVQAAGGNKFLPGDELARAICLQEIFKFRNGPRGDKTKHSPIEEATTARRIAKRWRGCGPSLGINFNLDLGRGNFDADARRFLAAPKHFPKQTHDPPARFFQVEQEADTRRYDGLPQQRAHSRIYVGQNHKLQKAK